MLDPRTTNEMAEDSAQYAIDNLSKYLPIIKASRSVEDLPTLRLLRTWIKADSERIDRAARIFYKEIDKAETIGGCLKAFEKMSNYRKHKEIANTIYDMCVARIWQLEDRKITYTYWKGEM